MSAEKTTLQRAREYEEKVLKQPSKFIKQVFHVCAPTGWINDPNGFSSYQGETHLFFQYHPYSCQWGPMHWGHIKTKDFVKWENLPVALAPEESYDHFGCFSGSAMEYQGKHVLAYTGVREVEKEDGSKETLQTQCIAVGDGLNYVKSCFNPIIQADSLPAGSSILDFRDPKIWEKEGNIYLLAGSRAADGSGQLVLYLSKDLETWDFVSIIEECNNEYGKMWECPDLFRIGESDVLIISPQEMEAKGLEFHSGNNTLALIGTFDEVQQKFLRNKVHAIDQGLDFYAPQTMLTQDGRRVMIGWMHTWETNLYNSDFDWCGTMCFPRTLEVRHGFLVQNPVEEICNYYKDKVCYHGEEIRGNTKLKGIEGRIFDMTIQVLEGEYSSFTIQVAKGNGHYTSIIYEPETQEFVVDRTYSGLRQDTVMKRRIAVRNLWKQKKESIKIRILADVYSLEIFINDGESVMSNLIFTPIESDEISFEAKGWLKADIEKYSISMEM